MDGETIVSKKTRKQFSIIEDIELTKLVMRYGEDNWKIIVSFMNGRTIRQCRERWKLFLKPSVERKEWSKNDEQLLEEKINEYGTHWTLLKKFFPGRTDIQLRNHWSLIQRHKYKTDKFNNMNQQKINSADQNLSISIKNDDKNNLNMIMNNNTNKIFDANSSEQDTYENNFMFERFFFINIDEF